MRRPLDELLRASAPDIEVSDAARREIAVMVASLVSELPSRPKARLSNRWVGRPMRFAVAGVATLALGAGAAAVAASVLSAPSVEITIPVEYLTESGLIVSCSADVQFENVPDSAVAELRSFAAAHDWTEFGERVRDRAIAEPVPPGMNESDPAGALRQAAIIRAIATSLEGELAEHFPDIRPSYRGLSTDCTGQVP